MKENLTTASSQVAGSLRDLPIKSDEFQSQIKSFAQWLRVFGFAETTIYYSPVYLRSFFHFLERSNILQIDRVTNSHILLYIHHLTGKISDRTGRRLSQSYILNHLNAIKLFSRYLVGTKGQLVDSNIRFSNGESGIRIWLLKSEIKRLYNSCVPGRQGDMNRALLGLYYGMGLRRMEGIGVDFSDIQWHNGLIYIRHAKLKQERYVPMSSAVQRDLEAYNFRYRVPILKNLCRVHEPAFLISLTGKRITGNAAYSRIQNLAKKAGVQIPLSLHSLRHSIATHLLQNGLSLENIGRFLGHKSLESTQIYTHLIHKGN
jgi:integrase/recombinase XerD